MLVSPDYYCKENLKGKSAKQIMSAIRGMKNKMGHLKNIMEHPNYNDEYHTCPSEATILSWTRECLEIAKEALVEAGGVYKPSQAEIRAEEVQDNLHSISKIIFSIGGYFGGDETRTVLIDSNKPNVCITHSLGFSPEEQQEDFPFPIDKDEFLDELSRLHIGEWRRSYYPERFGYTVLDGTQWELEIHFSNNTKPFISYGSNSFPYNFNEFQELLLIDTSVDEDEEEE